MNFVFYYDEFNIYNEPSKEEIKSFIKESYKEGLSGEDLATMAIDKFYLNEDHHLMLNQILDELEII